MLPRTGIQLAGRLSLSVRTRLANWLLRDVRVDSMLFGENSVQLTSLIKITGDPTPTQVGEIGMDASGMPVVYADSAARILSPIGAARGGLYISSASGTTLNPGTPVKVAGTTTLLGLESGISDDSGTSNRLKYTDAPTRWFLFVAALTSTHSSSSSILQTYLAKGGTELTNSRIDRKIGNGGDIGAMPLVWVEQLAQNDYVELFTDSVSGGTATYSRGILFALSLT